MPLFHRRLLEARTIFLQKPFTIPALEEKVQKALENAGKTATSRPETGTFSPFLSSVGK